MKLETIRLRILPVPYLIREMMKKTVAMQIARMAISLTKCSTFRFSVESTPMGADAKLAIIPIVHRSPVLTTTPIALPPITLALLGAKKCSAYFPLWVIYRTVMRTKPTIDVDSPIARIFTGNASPVMELRSSRRPRHCSRTISAGTLSPTWPLA
jgi:hypothetical protein